MTGERVELRCVHCGGTDALTVLDTREVARPYHADIWYCVRTLRAQVAALAGEKARISTDAWIVPKGFTAVAPNVMVSDTHIVVTGTPHPTEDENDPRYHNCDAMGCGRDHVIYRAHLDAARGGEG